MLPFDLTTLDAIAVAWFLIAWLGYGPFIHSPWAAPNINSRMNDVRRGWMHSMLGRDNRIVDASLLGNTMHSGTFFASTTMIALAALLGMLGKIDTTLAVLGQLSFTAKTSQVLVEGKVLLLLVVFGHTFLKLSWALRQLNYCLALIGAAPLKPSSEQRETIADDIGRVLSLALASFNAGIRGYYFALAALGWFLGPIPLLLLASGMLIMLLRRQFGSPTARAIRDCHADLLPVRTYPPAIRAVS